MSPEERHLPGQLAGKSHRACLVGHGQPVPGLDLEGGRARTQEFAHQPCRVGQQRFVSRSPGRRNRCANTTGLVSPSRHASGELLRAVPGEHQVRVAVHKTRHDGSALAVDPAVARRGPAGPHPRHLITFDDQGCAVQDTEPRAIDRVNGHELPDVVQQEARHPLRLVHGDPHPVALRHSPGLRVPGIDVADHAHPRIVGEDPLDLLGSQD